MFKPEVITLVSYGITLRIAGWLPYSTGNSQPVLEAVIDCDVPLESVEDAYQGENSNDADFVQELLEDCGTIPADLPSYVQVDWESTAFNVMMDYNESNNHYFSCNY